MSRSRILPLSRSVILACVSLALVSARAAHALQIVPSVGISQATDGGENRSMVALAPMTTPSSWTGANPSSVMSSTYDPGGSDRNRHCPFPSVVAVERPPMSAAELTDTTAPGMTLR